MYLVIIFTINQKPAKDIKCRDFGARLDSAAAGRFLADGVAISLWAQGGCSADIWRMRPRDLGGCGNSCRERMEAF